MIIHILPAKAYNHSSTISLAIISLSKESSQQIVLAGNNKINKQPYIDLFKKANFKNYLFCNSKLELIKTMRANRKMPLILHSDSYTWKLTAIMCNCKNINWVCWGSGATINKSFKSKITAPPKMLLYRFLNTIVTLTEADRQTFITQLKVKPHKVHTIGYIDTGKEAFFEQTFNQLLNSPPNNAKPRVLLGNNALFIDQYIDVMEKLKIYSGKIYVHCMVQYPQVSNEKYNKLIETGKKIFGDDFTPDLKFYHDQTDYYNYLNNYDIYISDNTTQNGEAVLHACSSIGKKIYINGNNYKWYKYMDITVFNTSMLKPTLTFEEFARPLTHDEKISNYEKRRKARREHPAKWQNYFTLIESHSKRYLIKT